MLSFIFSHIFSLRFRSLGIVWVTIIFSMLLIVFVLIYRNTLSALTFYSPSNIDPTRVTFVSDSSIFDMFSKDGGWLDPVLLSDIREDKHFVRTRALSFVDTNVIWKFDIFTFSFETDIPVFALDDSRWALAGFGISPSMIHYYNLELAGSHPMFPLLDEWFLEGKRVSLTFWASKIFQTSWPPSTPLSSTISSIDSDYPGFGIVVWTANVDPRLREIGVKDRSPYKLIAYMKDASVRWLVEAKYSRYKPRYDSDVIVLRTKQFFALKLSLMSVGWFFLVLILLLLLFLFSGYFREKSSIFELARIYGISFSSRQILIFGEPIFLLLVGLLMSFFIVWWSQGLLLSSLSSFLRSHGILFPLMRISLVELWSILCISFIVLILIVSFASRGKSR
jgi:hypothetical protein